MKYLKNERGLSLVELLATLVITSMIGIIVYAILFNGFKTYDRVKIESELRNEADIIMAELISDLFTLRSSEIISKHLPQNHSNNYFIESNKGITGFYEGKVYLKDESTKALQTGLIKLGNDSKITEMDNGRFHISLTLEWTENKQTLMTKSEVSIINDTE